MPIKYNGPKITIDEAKRFAKFALGNPRYVAHVQDLIDNPIPPTIHDDERDVLTGKTARLVREYMDANGLDWRLRPGYSEAMSLVRAILDGRIKDIDDPVALNFLKTSQFIDRGEDHA